MDHTIGQDKQDVIHRLIDVGFHIVEDNLEDGCEVGGATQGGALEGVPIRVVETRQPLNCGVEGACQVKAMGHRCAARKTRNTAETKARKTSVKSIGF